MARTNKYTSINFNDIYEKKASSSKTASSSSPSSPFSATSSHNASNTTLYKTHLTQGRMLVLSRPNPKPISIPPPQPKPQLLSSPGSVQTRSDPESDPISLRPRGSTGGGSPLSSPVPIQERSKEVVIPVTSPKPDRFVPPHLRPGFAGKEERPGFAGQKQRQQGSYGSPSRYGEDGRPKSGGHDRMRRGGDANLVRSTSFGNRPNSSGW